MTDLKHPSMKCDVCGKFRRGQDIRVDEHPNWNRTELEWTAWCRWCDPSMFKDEDR